MVYEDGRIQFHQKNDGARFLRHGAEAVDEWITLADVETLNRQHPGNRLVEQVIEIQVAFDTI